MVGLDELFHHGRNLLAPAPTAGVFSEGLKTTALPAIKAGTICPFGKCAGKLYGPSTATAPCGLWRTALRSPIAPSMRRLRSEEHTSELQSLMRISYAVFCLKKKNTKNNKNTESKNMIP